MTAYEEHYTVRTDQGYMDRIDRARERGDDEMEAYLILAEASLNGTIQGHPVPFRTIDNEHGFQVQLEQGFAFLRCGEVLRMFSIEVAS